MKLLQLITLSKRQKFVAAVLLLTIGVFITEFFLGIQFLIAAGILSFLTVIFLFLILRKDISGTFYLPILILPFFYTFSFILFYTLVPSRLLSRIFLAIVYGFGLYSLFLTENIFAVSGIRTINLLRSARIVSFIISIFILFFLINFISSLHLPFYIAPLCIFIVVFIINFHSLWTYSLDVKLVKDVTLYSFLISFCIMELAFVLTIWPLSTSIYSIFLTGIFYTFSGLSHAWIEKRLFKGVLWEYIWVGFLSILAVILFAKWGI